MKRILLILLLCSTYVLSFGQTKPNTFVEETSPTNANFEVYSQKNDLPRRASLNNLKEFFDQYIYTKTDSICIARQAGDTCVYFVPTDIDSIGMSNDTIILYGGTDAIADLPVSRLEAVIEIGSSNITNGDIATVDIADGAINSAKIADGSIVSGDIFDGTIATADLADLVVTLAKIAPNAIDSTKLINGGLSGADLADAAILTAKIADGQITEPKIADNAVALGKLQQINSNRLLGRYSSGIGDVEQISIGSGLSLVGTTLTATVASVNSIDSINSTRSGDEVTISIYSSGSLVNSTTFTDNSGGSYADLDTIIDVNDWAPVSSLIDDYKYISVTLQTESGDASDAQLTLPSPATALAKTEIYVHAWDEDGTRSPKIVAGSSVLYYQSATTNMITLTDGHTYRVQAEQNTGGAWYWIVNDITNDGSSSVSQLSDLTDIGITSPSNGDILSYNSSSGDWENTSIEGRVKGYEQSSADGLVITFRAIEYLGSSDGIVYTLSGNASSGYTFTVDNDAWLLSLIISGGPSNLDSGGDLKFNIVTGKTYANEASEYRSVPRLESNGQFIIDWPTYGITGSYTNPSNNNINYTFGNLGGFGASGYKLYFNF